jgi:hypothetical protein
MARLVGVLVAAAALFAAGIAVSAFGAHADTPLKSQTYTDPASDEPSGAPDITGIVVDNHADGTIDVAVALPRAPALSSTEAVGVLIDSDLNRTTGQDGFDYLLALGGAYPRDPNVELLKWTGTAWVVQAPGTMTASFTSLVGANFSVAKTTIGVGSTLSFIVRASQHSPGTPAVSDDAPGGTGLFTYDLGTPPATTTATTSATTLATTPRPKPVPRCKKGQHSTKKKPCRRR